MPPAGLEQPVRFFLLAAWFGLLTGLVEVCLLAVKKILLHRILLLSSQVIWMAPVADLALFNLAALGLILIARGWPRFATLRLAVALFAFLGFLSLLLRIGGLHRYAALLLAAGLSVQAARLVVVHHSRFHSLVQRTLVWIAAVVVMLGLGVQGWGILAERRALAASAPSSPDAPNVLLIVLDTVRAQSLGLHGHGRPTTPHLERWAKAGVVFERAIPTSSWTLPSHAGLFTGRYPFELSVSQTTPLDGTYPTLAEALGSHGYLTAGFVANILSCSAEWGLSRGFARYEDFRVSPGEVIISSSLGGNIARNPALRRIVGYYEMVGRKSAADLNRDFLQWLSVKDPQRPFFAFLNYFDAHEPYLPPKPFDGMFGHKAPRRNFKYGGRGVWRSAKRKMSPQEVQAELDAYEGAIAYIDHHVGSLLDTLQKRGALQHTLVIITSDHGEEFGEHGVFGHGVTLYWPSLHVPLVIVFPSRLPAGKRVREPVTLRDIPATVLDLLQLKDTSRFPGASLARYWNNGPDPSRPGRDSLLSEVEREPRRPDWYPVRHSDLRSLVLGRYHYIRSGDRREELYDIEQDPWETRDLADTEKGRRALKRFRTSLQTILGRGQ